MQSHASPRRLTLYHAPEIPENLAIGPVVDWALQDRLQRQCRRLDRRRSYDRCAAERTPPRGDLEPLEPELFRDPVLGQPPLPNVLNAPGPGRRYGELADLNFFLVRTGGKTTAACGCGTFVGVTGH